MVKDEEVLNNSVRERLAEIDARIDALWSPELGVRESTATPRDIKSARARIKDMKASKWIYVPKTEIGKMAMKVKYNIGLSEEEANRLTREINRIFVQDVCNNEFSIRKAGLDTNNNLEMAYALDHSKSIRITYEERRQWLTAIQAQRKEMTK